MTKFQLGLLIGFILGAVSMFVVQGVIGLYLEERQQKRGAAKNLAAQEEIPGPAVVRPYTDYAYPDNLSAAALKEPQAEDDQEKIVICPLLIRTE